MCWFSDDLYLILTFYFYIYRSCYNDCKAALKASPIYVKAERRLAQVCCELGLFEECVQLCDKLLDGAVDDKLSAVRLRALKEKVFLNKLK